MKRLLKSFSLVLLASSLFATASFAEVPAQLKILVKNIDDEKPIAAAKVEIQQSIGSPRISGGATATDGSLTSGPLEGPDCVIRITAESFEPQQRKVDLRRGEPQTLVFKLEPAETTIVVKEERRIIQSNSPNGKTTRDSDFLSGFPLGNQNPQQLSGLLLSVPGFVPDSANQVHPRGEHSATSIMIQGFQLGGANQGRFGPILDSRVLDSVDVLTGSYAPEFGSQSAAILNTSIRSGGKVPERKFEIGLGSYDTLDLFASVGGQTGSSRREDSDEKVIGYYLASSLRRTDNALEPPQAGDQTAHNGGESATLLGKLDLHPSAEDTITLIANVAPARTQVANRSGLPPKYQDVGQGYGFGGALSEAQASSSGILSQEALGQDIYQDDINGFSVLQWQHDFSKSVRSLLSFGMNQSNLDVKNNNPQTAGELPPDSSIEFDPRVKRHARHLLGSGSLSAEVGTHTLKSGAYLDFQQSDDAYQLAPRSQLALDALAAQDGRFIPNDNLSGIPTVNADSSGYYHAAYVQDTWKLSEKFTANYGLRFDIYRQKQDGDRPSLDKSQFSPRLNLSYALLPKTILRGSYNRLFIDPPLSQGSVIGNPISPERVHQYDISMEQQIGSRQKAKVAYYYKDIQNQIDTGLLIPSTQLGIFTSVNLDRAHVQGVEFSYDLLAEKSGGSSAFVTYAYSVARPFGKDNLGNPVEAYNDHDQRNTLSAGTAYTFSSGESIGLTQYFGSGLFSSPIEEGAPRQTRTQTNVSLSTEPKFLFNRGGLKLEAQNLFDERARLNFQSAFSGTRFQQGRTILVSSFFTF